MIGIVGYGRFAKTLIRLFEGESLMVLSRTKQAKTASVLFTQDVEQLYQCATAIFYCVPIRALEQMIVEHKPHISNHHTLLDVLSVKLHPKRLFDRYLKTSGAQIILTHPMFGPDSSVNGFNGLPIMMDQYRSTDECYCYWKAKFESKGLCVIPMTADEHDIEAARSQGITHFVGRLLQAYDYSATKIDTLGAHKLKEIMDQVCNDTWELYMDLQQYNPYTKREVEKLKVEFDSLYRQTHGD